MGYNAVYTASSAFQGDLVRNLLLLHVRKGIIPLQDVGSRSFESKGRRMRSIPTVGVDLNVFIDVMNRKSDVVRFRIEFQPHLNSFFVDVYKMLMRVLGRDGNFERFFDNGNTRMDSETMKQNEEDYLCKMEVGIKRDGRAFVQQGIKGRN